MSKNTFFIGINYRNWLQIGIKKGTKDKLGGLGKTILPENVLDEDIMRWKGKNR